jgi:hypothetical protein
MTALRRLLDALPLSVLLIASLTLGLAPFVPEPHIWEKLKAVAAACAETHLGWTARSLTPPLSVAALRR